MRCIIWFAVLVPIISMPIEVGKNYAASFTYTDSKGNSQYVLYTSNAEGIKIVSNVPADEVGKIIEQIKQQMSFVGPYHPTFGFPFFPGQVKSRSSFGDDGEAPYVSSIYTMVINFNTNGSNSAIDAAIKHIEANKNGTDSTVKIYPPALKQSSYHSSYRKGKATRELSNSELKNNNNTPEDEENVIKFNKIDIIDDHVVSLCNKEGEIDSINNATNTDVILDAVKNDARIQISTDKNDEVFTSKTIVKAKGGPQTQTEDVLINNRADIQETTTELNLDESPTDEVTMTDYFTEINTESLSAEEAEATTPGLEAETVQVGRSNTDYKIEEEESTTLTETSNSAEYSTMISRSGIEVSESASFNSSSIRDETGRQKAEIINYGNSYPPAAYASVADRGNPSSYYPEVGPSFAVIKEPARFFGDGQEDTVRIAQQHKDVHDFIKNILRMRG